VCYKDPERQRESCRRRFRETYYQVRSRRLAAAGPEQRCPRCQADLRSVRTDGLCVVCRDQVEAEAECEGDGIEGYHRVKGEA
jgi:hypothetical protein